jgi:hypothetical protein
VLRGDFETRATAVGNLIEKGVMKPSEARPLFDLPDAGEVADQLYGNAALVPLGSSVHGQQVTPEVVARWAHRSPATSSGRWAASASRPRWARGARRTCSTGSVRARQGSDEGQARGRRAPQGPGTTPAGSPTLLSPTSADLATAKAIGSTVAKSLGGSYDVGEIADWIHENAVTSAKAINATTIASPQGALDGADDPSAGGRRRVRRPGRRRTDSIDRRVPGGDGRRLASLNSAGQNGAATKTWVTGPNPRPSTPRWTARRSASTSLLQRHERPRRPVRRRR